MDNKWRKLLNILLVIMLVVLSVISVIAIVNIIRIHKRRVEEANHKPNSIEQSYVEERVSENAARIEEDEEKEYNDDTDEILQDSNEYVAFGYLLDYEPINIDEIPNYSGIPYYQINNGIPNFAESDINCESFEYYSQLDSLGRCGVATANISNELMPTEERGNIGHIKPSGWHTVKYPELISDRYLYNRCHLIAYSLCGENDNERNLITGTRYMNVSGMLPFENDVLSYIERTNNHVLYRVTPCFVGTELVARGVQIEAYSVEDNGKGICINVYVYNVQPGIEIDYATGDSWVEDEE